MDNSFLITVPTHRCGSIVSIENTSHFRRGSSLPDNSKTGINNFIIRVKPFKSIDKTNKKLFFNVTENKILFKSELNTLASDLKIITHKILEIEGGCKWFNLTFKEHPFSDIRRSEIDTFLYQLNS